MGWELVLLEYLKNPNVEFLFRLFVFSFAVGIFGLSYRFFVIQKGDKEWVKLSAMDKFFVSLMVGMLSLIISVIILGGHLTIVMFLEVVGVKGLSTSYDTLLVNCFVFVTSLYYVLFLARKISKDKKCFHFVSELFRWKNASYVVLLGVIVSFVGFGALTFDLNLFVVGIVLFVVAVIVKKLRKKYR